MKKEHDEKVKEEDKKQNKAHEKKANEEMETLKAELKVLREETAARDDYYDKYLRLQAEFDNFRKRALKDREEFIKFANEALVLELVSILDDFERGIKSAEGKKDFQLLHQGVDMISKQLHRLLEDKGLKKINCLGEKFDPHQHEAIEVVEDETEKEAAIVEELQPGYTLNGRVIRPAKVKVVKKKTVEKQEQSEDEDTNNEQRTTNN